MNTECEGACLPHCYSNNIFTGILIGILIMVILYYYKQIKNKPKI